MYIYMHICIYTHTYSHTHAPQQRPSAMELLEKSEFLKNHKDFKAPDPALLLDVHGSKAHLNEEHSMSPLMVCTAYVYIHTHKYVYMYMYINCLYVCSLMCMSLTGVSE